MLGDVAWSLCFSAYLWPRLKAMDCFDAQRASATLHRFRFFGLVLLVVAFNVAGIIDLVMDYAHAIQAGLLHVPLLMITHVAAFHLLLRPAGRRQDGPALQA